MKITIQWHGHSCFSVTADGYTVVLDPYDDSLEGYAPLSLTGNAVLCSHGHHDHAWVQAVELEKTDLLCPFTVEKVLTAHDDCGGTKRGENIIHVLSVDGKRIVHCGDLGHALSPAQVNAIGDADVLRCDAVVLRFEKRVVKVLERFPHVVDVRGLQIILNRSKPSTFINYPEESSTL